MCTVSMRAQHELLHVDARHLWLTRQENRGKRSQNHDAKLTRPFLRVGRGWLARLILGVPSIFDFLLFTVAVAKVDLLRTPLYHTPRTNQMGYIIVKAQLPGIYGNVNPWRLGFNYYMVPQ